MDPVPFSPLQASTAVGARGQVFKYRSSCDSCHRLKVKCGQEKETCYRCQTHGRTCIYGISQRRGKLKGSRKGAANTLISRSGVTSSTAWPESIYSTAPYGFICVEDTIPLDIELPEHHPSAEVQLHHADSSSFHGTEPTTANDVQGHDDDLERIIDEGLGDYDFLTGFDSTTALHDDIIVGALSPGDGLRTVITRDVSTPKGISSRVALSSGCSSGMDPIVDVTEKASTPQQPPRLRELPAPKGNPVARSCSSMRQCNHEAFLLDRAVLIEHGFQNHNTPSSGPKEHQLSFERLLFLTQTAIPMSETKKILSCPTCQASPSTTLCLVILLDKVLGLYAAFLEDYHAPLTPSTDGATPSPELRPSPEVSSAGMSPLSPPSWQLSPHYTTFQSPTSDSLTKLHSQAFNEPVPTSSFLETYALSSTEQREVQRLLIRSRLSGLRTLIDQLQVRVKCCGVGTINDASPCKTKSSAVRENMQMKCEPLVIHLRERLVSIQQHLDDYP